MEACSPRVQGVNMSMNTVAYTQFIQSIVQSAKQLATQLNTYKTMVLQVASGFGLKDINVTIKRIDNTIIIGIEYEFENEEKAKQVMEDIKKRLG